jgi:hypothetical protein
MAENRQLMNFFTVDCIKIAKIKDFFVQKLVLVSKELNHLAAILHVYARSLIFMK